MDIAAPNQMRHWRHFQRHQNSAALNMTMALFCKRPDYGRLLGAARSVVNSCAVFNHRPFERDGQLYWVEAPSQGNAFQPLIEVSSDEELLACMRREAATPFDLAAGELFRIAPFTVKDGNGVLLLNIHHIVCDGWSMDALIERIAREYEDGACDPFSWGQTSDRYREFSAYQWAYASTAYGDRDLKYWMGRLTKKSVGRTFGGETLHSSNCRSAHFGPSGRMTWWALPSDLASSVRATARTLHTTPFTVLFGAYGLLLAKHASTDSVTVGVPYMNRLRPGDGSLIGFVVNTLAITVSAGVPPSLEYLKSVKEELGEAFVHQRLPYIRVLSELDGHSSHPEIPPFGTMFIMQSTRPNRTHKSSLWNGRAWVSTGCAKYDQTWTVEERGNIYTLDIEWDPSLFSDHRIESLVMEYVDLVYRLTDGGLGERVRGQNEWAAIPSPRNTSDYEVFRDSPIIVEG
jgi:hypothetical protein